MGDVIGTQAGRSRGEPAEQIPWEEFAHTTDDCGVRARLNRTLKTLTDRGPTSNVIAPHPSRGAGVTGRRRSGLGERVDETLHGGKVTMSPDGSYDLGSGKPFTWIKVGEKPITELEGARSFTITGWLKASGMKVGSGGNRILFSLQHNHAGIDLVHHANGAMRLAVNEWPDSIKNDSSSGRVQIGKWIFFAVTYDASRANDNVCWYFGDENTRAELDRKTDYNNGPVDEGSANLVIGNFNKTLQGAGLDRQFRGKIRRLQIHASRLGGRGALSRDRIRELQKMK